MEFILCLAGMVMVVEGLPYFLFPGRVKEVLATLLEKPDRALRIMGLGLMATGLFIVWAARR